MKKVQLRFLKLHIQVALSQAQLVVELNDKSIDEQKFKSQFMKIQSLLPDYDKTRVNDWLNEQMQDLHILFQELIDPEMVVMEPSRDYELDHQVTNDAMIEYAPHYDALRNRI